MFFVYDRLMRVASRFCNIRLESLPCVIIVEANKNLRIFLRYKNCCDVSETFTQKSFLTHIQFSDFIKLRLPLLYIYYYIGYAYLIN